MVCVFEVKYYIRGKLTEVLELEDIYYVRVDIIYLKGDKSTLKVSQNIFVITKIITHYKDTRKKICNVKGGEKNFIAIEWSLQREVMFFFYDWAKFSF